MPLNDDSPDADIYREAQRLIDQHGGKAKEEAELLAKTFRITGDFEGERIWLRIKAAVIDLRSESRFH